MGEYEVRIGTTLKFNAEKEHDIIEKVENLAERRKISEFLVSLIRVAFDNPDILKLVEANMDEYGLTDERKQFFTNVESEVSKMRYKVDSIFDKAVKVYMLAQFGKKIGMDKRATALVQAQFILQKQIDELCSTLGVSSLSHIYDANRTDSIMAKSDEVLEYIIDTYDNVVTELRANIIGGAHVTNSVTGPIKNDSANSQSKDINAQPTNSVNVEETGSITKNVQIDNSDKQEYNIDESQNKNSELLPNNEEVKDDDEIINFGEGADISALSKFIGG